MLFRNPKIHIVFIRLILKLQKGYQTFYKKIVYSIWGATNVYPVNFAIWAQEHLQKIWPQIKETFSHMKK